MAERTADLERYHREYELAQYYLELLNVSSFPINMREIVKRINTLTGFHILLVGKSEYLAYKKTPFNIGGVIKIEDGRCYRIPYGKGYIYLIICNDSKPLKRARFTAAHELGHILLGHLENDNTEMCRGGIPEECYKEYENSADVFAGNFLAPPVLINERMKMPILKNTEYIIGETFKISEAAAHNRCIDLKAWRNRDYISAAERIILERCRDSVCFMVCRKCRAYNVIPRTEDGNYGRLYCRYCGSGELIFTRKEKRPVYLGVKTDRNYKAVSCPVCGNNALEKNGDFCDICGYKLINECSSEKCGYKGRLDGETRYCPFCGSKSVFFADGLIEPI